MTLRLLNRSLQTAVDVVLLSVAYWLAFLFRFEFAIPSVWLRVQLTTWPYVILLMYASLAAFGVPRMSWRYIGIGDVGRIFAATSAATSVLVIVRIIRPLINIHAITIVTIPLGILAMNFVLSFLALVGIRALRRVQGEASDRKRQVGGDERHRVLLIGAGEAGVLVAREIARRADLGLQPVGYLDDDPLKIGTRIGGLTVLGSTRDVAAVAERKHVQRVLITIANAAGEQIRRITELCRDARLETKIIPGIYELVGDKVNLSRIREVAIEDLLGREPVHLDEDIVGSSILGRVVFVTGAGGSIGSELCRQVCRFGPARLVLVERFENALFEIHRELVHAFPSVLIEPAVADVCDAHRMAQLFESIKPELVFHAAAHKHVPMMEWNPGEAVKNNVGGTRTVADLSVRFGVQRFVLVSTDKAVNPTSVMGATKRIAEIYVQALSRVTDTRFVTVRFGNVLGSNGSVVPIFRQQIAKGGPVMVTHPDMLRYFMTIPEASQLVLQAGAMGAGGEICILDMGRPVRIVDLARDLITLSGLRPDDDIEIRFTGIRPGEKLVEELATDAEHADKTTHPKIFIRKTRPHQFATVERDVKSLLVAAHDHDVEGIHRFLGVLVPEFSQRRATPQQSEHDDEQSADSSLRPTIPN
jgi:FlaA1/EpsC-like NDP-sugar epimerase